MRSADAGGNFDRAHFHAGQQSFGLARVERSGADVLSRLRPTCHAERQALARRRALVAGRGVAGEEAVPRADTGNGLERLDLDLVALAAAVLGEDRNAAGGLRDDRLAGAHLEETCQSHREVVVVVELVTDGSFGLLRVRRHDCRLRAEAEPHWLALRVEQSLHFQPSQLRDEPRVEAGVHLGRECSGEHTEAGALREVHDLLDESIHLVGTHHRPALVDLRLLSGGGIDDGEVGPRLALDVCEVVEDGLLRQELEDPSSGGSAGQARRDHRPAEELERAGDVHSLAAGDRARLHRSMTAAEPQVRNCDRPVDRRVQCHRQDHRCLPLERSPATLEHCRGTHPGLRPKTVAAISITNAAAATTSNQTTIRGPGTASSTDATRPPPDGCSGRAATAATRPTGSPSTVTVADPWRSPRCIGASTAVGAFSATSTLWPRLTVVMTDPAA